MSSVYQGAIHISIFGQSHGEAIGVVMDGLPAGEPIDEQALRAFLQRRAPGGSDIFTSRKEADTPRILSGLVNGRTCGAPLCAVMENTDVRPGDYTPFQQVPRPGHADYTAQVKYGGYQDASGGGHFSGRLTAAFALAGGICLQLLARLGVTVGAHLLQVGHVRDQQYDPVDVCADILRSMEHKPFPVLDDAAGEQMRRAIRDVQEQGDSLGGIIECACVGLPAGWGDPMLDGMENRIARLLFAIPGVKGVEFGDGFAAAARRGSENNDGYCVQQNGVQCRTNHAGGILGGITNGMPLIFRCAVKPTPSIALPQESVNLATGETQMLAIKGRHDPCIAPRAVPVAEAAAAIALLDAALMQRIHGQS